MLIAEIGNNHFGCINKAKELIRIANECGADLIKSQAFKAKDIKSGSMPKIFYEMCEFNFDEYLELIEYARSIKNDLFYTVFSSDLKALFHNQNWYKISGHQYSLLDGKQIEMIDSDRTFISIPYETKYLPIKKSTVLHVTDYMCKNPRLEQIEKLNEWYRRPSGLSDHSIGIKNCIKSVRNFGVHIIEKHFTLKKNIKFGSVIYRDTIHSCEPKELERLSYAMSDM